MQPGSGAGVRGGRSPDGGVGWKRGLTVGGAAGGDGGERERERGRAMSMYGSGVARAGEGPSLPVYQGAEGRSAVSPVFSYIYVG